MKYISTRGQAPILSFEEAMLTGLARDGGLYVPQEIPQFSTADIAALAGLPYEEVAFRVMWPFLGESFTEEEFREIIAKAYASFGHTARAPMVQLGPNHFLLELFHGPTLAFKDFAMQLIGQLFQVALHRRGEKVTIVGATSGDTGSAAIEAFRGLDAVDVFILFPHGRVSEVQRRQMTTPSEANVHALALDGDFDDCQARLKDMFNHFEFRDEVRLAGVNSINWARVLAQVVYYFSAATALGAPHRPVSFTVPTGNFGDIFAGYIARSMGLPIEKLIIATNQNDILHRAITSGGYITSGVTPSISPSMDIQVSSNFERALFDAYGRDGNAVAQLMDELKGQGGFTISQGALQSLRESFASGRASEEETSATIKRLFAETGEILCPHSAVGVKVAEEQMGATPMITLATAHPAKFPDAVEAATGQRPPLPNRMADLYERPERVSRVDNDLAALEALIKKARFLSVQLDRLPNGLRIVTETMPGLESAAVGLWVNAGGRHERIEQNGIAHFLEHMAFKGTKRRSALQIAEEIEDVGGFINAYTSREATAYYARVLKADVPLALDVIADIVLNPVFAPEEIEVERGVILQEIGQALDTPDDIVFDWLQEAAYPDQPLGRTILGPTERVASFGRKDLSGFIAEHYTPGQMVLSAAGAVDHEQIMRLAEAAFGHLPALTLSQHDHARFRGGERRELKKLEQVHFALALEGPAYSDDDVYTAQIYSTLLGGGMSSRLFQEIREKRGLCYTIFAQAGAYADTGMMTLYAGTSADDIDQLAALTVDELRRVASDVSDVEVNRARAQMKAGLLMGLESPSSRAERLARLVAIWDRVPPLEETVERIEAVDRQSVAAFAARIAGSGQAALALYGPASRAPELGALKERLAA